MESIIDILHKGGYSCVMKNREEVRTFTQRGVADLYDLSGRFCIYEGGCHCR